MYNSFNLETIKKENPGYQSRLPFEHQIEAFGKLSELFTFNNNEHVQAQTLDLDLIKIARHYA